MSQSLSKLYVHIIYHIKKSGITIGGEIQEELYAYMASILKENDSTPVLINGEKEHVHILCIRSKNISLAKLIEKVKGQRSRWIKTRNSKYKLFGWQGGYAGFSVSKSLVEKTKKYIREQKEHHNKKSYKEELMERLKLYDVDYDHRYLWDDKDYAGLSGR
jgi:REP element-mobilizing transposase RayT